MSSPMSTKSLLPGKQRWDKFLFREALEMMPPNTTIVEIGAIRDLQPAAQHADGWSSLTWAGSGRPVYIVDTDSDAILKTKELIGDYLPNVEYVISDGIYFLKNYRSIITIGLLYLDGPDPDQDGQQVCLDAFKAALPHLADGAVVLIDDCDFEDNGKGKYVFEIIHRLGGVLMGVTEFEVVGNNVRQLLLRKL